MNVRIKKEIEEGAEKRPQGEQNPQDNKKRPRQKQDNGKSQVFSIEKYMPPTTSAPTPSLRQILNEQAASYTPSHGASGNASAAQGRGHNTRGNLPRSAKPYTPPMSQHDTYTPLHGQQRNQGSSRDQGGGQRNMQHQLNTSQYTNQSRNKGITVTMTGDGFF